MVPTTLLELNQPPVNGSITATRRKTRAPDQESAPAATWSSSNDATLRAEKIALRAAVVRRDGRRARLKRAVDVVGACLLLALLVVPMALLAVLIKLTSRGPVFYRQERVGLNGRRFTLVKFRTMNCDAERETGPVWARKNDPRRTWLGAALRRWSIDELPQLINVLRGEMSLVGPRPERPCFVDQFAEDLPCYDLRHQVQPGLSGWAQLNGFRGDTSLAGRLDHDLYYVRNWSLPLDLYIIALTPLSIVTEKNAC